MFTVEISVLLMLSLVLAGATVIRSVRTALPQIAALRQALEQCPETFEVRFTVRETVVRFNDGKVVPLRPRRPVSLPRPQSVRAAA